MAHRRNSYRLSAPALRRPGRERSSSSTVSTRTTGRHLARPYRCFPDSGPALSLDRPDPQCQDDGPLPDCAARRSGPSGALASAAADSSRPLMPMSVPGLAGRATCCGASSGAGTCLPASSLAEHRVDLGVVPELPYLLVAATRGSPLGCPCLRLLA